MKALVAVVLAAGSASLLPGAPVEALTGHTEAVVAAALSPDGGVLVTSSLDRSVRAWRLGEAPAAAGLLVDPGPLDGGAVPVVAVAFSDDGSQLALGDQLFTVKVLRWPEPSPRATLVHPAAASSLAFHPRGDALAVASPNGVGAVYELPTGATRFDFVGRCAAWSSDGASLAVGVPSGGVVVLDGKTGKKKKTIATPNHAPVQLAWLDGSTLLTSNPKDPELKRWSLATGKPLAPLGSHAKGVGAFSVGSGVVVSTGVDLEAKAWAVPSGLVLARHPVQRTSFALADPAKAWLPVVDGTVVKLWRWPDAGQPSPAK